MRDEDLIRELNFLGIDERNFRVLALMPLVQVAWADGKVQDTERSLIVALAKDEYKLDDDGLRILDNWFEFAPTDGYVRRGRSVLLELATRGRGLKLNPSDLDDVVSFAEDVARAAGGLFGIRAIEPREHHVLVETALALQIDTASTTWHDVAEDLDDRPKMSDTMSFEPGEIKVAFGHEDAGGAARVVYVDDERVRHCHEITERGVTIGRGRDCSIQIAHDARVSRLHGEFLIDGLGRYYFVNHSENGSWVNGERVRDRRLFGGEKVLVASHTFVFEANLPGGPDEEADADTDETQK